MFRNRNCRVVRRLRAMPFGRQARGGERATVGLIDEGLIDVRDT
jgi:hypothetical protein